MLSRGFQQWPLARGGFKRVGARGSSHSHGRTSQEHQSKVSPCPQLSRHCQGPEAPLRIHTHINPPNTGATLRPKGPLQPQVAEINCGKISAAGGNEQQDKEIEGVGVLKFGISRPPFFFRQQYTLVFQFRNYSFQLILVPLIICCCR